MDETMTTGEQILSAARTLTGADESEGELLEMICSAQELILERALRADVTKEECRSAFVCAGAFLAAAALESARAGGEELSSLRAGDVTLTKRTAGEGGNGLAQMREQAWALMRPYTKDGGFYFCGVQG